MSVLVSQAASASRTVVAATKAGLVSRDILIISSRGLERGLEGERQNVGAQRVGSVVQRDRLLGGRAGSALVESAPAAGREDVGVGGVQRVAAAEGIADAEH